MAQVPATEKFEQYLEQRLNPKAISNPLSGLKWTDSETDFAELVYAFYQQCTFNGGNISLQNLSEQLALAFNIAPPNSLYRLWTDIKVRAKGVDYYLNILRSGLIKRSKKKVDIVD